MKKPFLISLVTLLPALTFADTAPFGDAMSISEAGKLWKALESAKMVGKDAIASKPYKGVPPHGAILDTIEGKITVDGHTGTAIVKRNYGGEGVDVAAVANSPGKNLGAVTVMFKREAGYDPENKDWFYAKFKSDGSLHMNPKKMQLAGKVGKGAAQGCIACHKAAPGGDYVFNHDRYK